MRIKNLVCAGLLASVGCAVPQVAAESPEIALAPNVAPPTIGAAAEDTDNYGIQGWVPEIFEDLWEIFDVDIGADRGFGLSVQATNLARVGIFDYSDFGLLGLESRIFEGQWDWPVLQQQDNGHYVYDSSVWDVNARFGIGFGGSIEIHTWEIIDFLSTLVTANYWSFDDD